MSKELEQLEKWIDENKGTALHPIMGNNPSITQLFIDTLLQKITELKAEEGEEENNELIEKINSRFEQEKWVTDKPKGYHPDDVSTCQKIIETVEIIKLIINPPKQN